MPGGNDPSPLEGPSPWTGTDPPGITYSGFICAQIGCNQRPSSCSTGVPSLCSTSVADYLGVPSAPMATSRPRSQSVVYVSQLGR